MPSLSVIKTALREITTLERNKRIPEPYLIMDDPEKVAAYTRAGREDGVMASVYLYHCAQICEIVHPGKTIVDLACGPATQLVMVARLNPETRFIGVDLSTDMLKKAEAYVLEQNLQNIEFKQGDITDLTFFKDHSIDVITSTVALHHLPDVRALEQTFSEISRILKENGGLYLVDFGYLKSEKSIHSFAYQYADQQQALFTLDYLYSLRAAFTLKEFKKLQSIYLRQAKLYSTFIMPFMVAIKQNPKKERLNVQNRKVLRTLRNQLPSQHKRDLSDLHLFFRLGGLRNRLLE